LVSVRHPVPLFKTAVEQKLSARLFIEMTDNPSHRRAGHILPSEAHRWLVSGLLTVEVLLVILVLI